MKRKSLLLLLLLALGLPWATRAQETLTVYDGTSNVSSVPVYSYFTHYGVGSQYIVSSDDLSVLSNGTISKLTYYCGSQSVSWGNALFKVYLGETESEAFAGSNAMAWADMTEVYSGSLSVSGGVMEITFTTPYLYQGDNLVIGVNQTTTGTQGGSVSWYGVDDSGNRALYSIFGSFNVESKLPKTTITYTAGIAPTCPKPRNLTATLTDGNGAIATLNWTEKGSATTWVLQCGADVNFGTGTYSEYTVTTNPTKDLTGLTPETTYYARVKSECDEDDQSVWSATCHFTPSNKINLLLNDGTQTSSYVPMVSPNGYGSQFIIPAEGLSDAAYGQLTQLAFYATASTASWGTTSYELFLMETPDSFFTGNVKYPESEMTKVYTGTLLVNDGLMTINFDTPYYYEGGNLVVYIKEDYNGAYAYCIWYGVTTTNNQALSGTFGTTLYKFLPKMTVSYLAGETPAHPRPKYFKTTNITSTSATFTWTNGGSETTWQIAYIDDEDADPDDIPATNVVDVTTNPYTLSGLVGGTDYYSYIRAVVGNEHSDWSKVCSFTPSCDSPYNFGPNYVTVNSARLTWINGGTESEWQIVYAAEDENFDPDLATPIDVTTKPYLLTGLTTDVHYYARIRAKCDIGDYSDWSEVCQIYPTCIEPSTLNATILSATSVKLSWSPGGNQSSWQIAYTDNATTLPDDATIVNVSAYPPYTLTGLTTNVTYYAYVRSDCGTEHYSNWSAVCAFTPTYVLTVNDGTKTNSYVPVYGYWVDKYSKSQFIIPANSLESITNSNIDKLVFYCSNTSINWGAAEFDVCIKETSQSNFTSATLDWTDMETVYSGSLTAANGMMEIQFADAFNYQDGNLLIGIKETKSGTDMTSNWYGVSTTSNTAVGGYENTRALGLYQFLPKTTLYYTPGSAPTCIKPTGLIINESFNSAVLTWTAGADETHWNVQYKAASATDWNALIAVEDTPECLLAGLTPATTYQVRVQSDCGSGDVSGWVTGSFATTCGAFNLPYEHHFDDDAPGATAGLPGCWTRINDSQTTTYQNYPRILADEAGQMHSHSSPNYLLFYRLGDYTALNQIAVLPEMNAPVNTLILHFFAKLNDGNSNQKLVIGVMSDPNDAATFVKYQDVTIASSTYAEYMVDFKDYEGQGTYIAIKCERGDETRYFIDDISINMDQTCRVPVALQISNITAQTAVFTWTPGSETTAWQVQYKKTTDAEWSEPVAVNGTASYTFNNLTAATDYEVRVRTVCGEANYSDWVSTTFTTECNYMSLPYSHNFENDEVGVIAPACWHLHGSYYPRIDDDPYNYGHAHSGQNCLMIYQNSDNAVNYVVLPEINTAETPINTLQVTFWGKRFGNEVYQYTYFDNLYLGVMTDPNDVSTFQYVSGAYTNIANLDEYKFFELYLDNYSGEGTYLAIRYNGSPLYYIDDIEVSVAPTCRQPLDLSTQYTHAHEAEIRWKTRDLRQCNYQVSYSTDATFNPEDGTIVDVEFENTLVNAGTDYRDYYLTCLNANTTYYYYVRANCGNGDFSEWSDDYASLTTDEACPEPYDFGTTLVKNTYAIIHWYGDLDANWEFRYKKTADDEWITPATFDLASGEGNELLYRLENLETNVEYVVQLRLHCGMYTCPAVDDGYSEWVTTSFTTSEGCQTPSGWMCMTHMGTSATLEWNQTGEENYWQIRYRLSTENEYPVGNIVLTDYMPEAKKQRWTITGLQANSMYYWQVRAYCDENDQSAWSAEKYFFTGGEKVTVDKAHPFYEDFESVLGMPDGWMRCNQYNYNLDYYYPWSFTLAEGPSWDERPGNHGIYNNSDDYHGSTSVILPEMHIDENAVSTMFSFWSYCDYGPSAISGQNISYGSMQIMASTNHGETYDYLWWSFGPHRYWHQHFVDLDDYIGQDVIIRIDYWYANNNPNFDWYIDDVKVQVFDNSFGSGPDVTSGAWDDPTMWGNGTPDGDDDVIINANVTIPDGVVAQANNIVINTDTINTGNRAQKFGKLIIANGGQLITNNAVEVTAQKTVTPWTTNPAGGWYFIASPVDGTLKPKDVDNMLTDETAEPYSYDLYRLNGTQWENYHAHNTNEQPFYLQNGNGYLYANATGATLEFTGEIKTYDPANNTVPVSEGWNLIGNPYTFDAYPNTSYYVMNSTQTGLDPQTKQSNNAVPPCTSIIVKAGTSGTVAFSKEAPVGQAGGGNLQIALAQTNTRGADRIDNAIVSFNEGDELSKFYFGESLANITIPQNGEDYSIVSAEAQGELPLNFKTNENGSYTLRFSSLNTEFSYLHLIDNLTGNDVDLLETPSYTFDARQTDYASRFKLVFVKDNADRGDDFAFISNGEIIVNGTGTLQVFDVLGHELFRKELSTLHSPLSTFHSPGVYVLRLVNGENVKNQKIIIK